MEGNAVFVECGRGVLDCSIEEVVVVEGGGGDMEEGKVGMKEGVGDGYVVNGGYVPEGGDVVRDEGDVVF